MKGKFWSYCQCSIWILVLKPVYFGKTELNWLKISKWIDKIDICQTFGDPFATRKPQKKTYDSTLEEKFDDPIQTVTWYSACASYSSHESLSCS